MALILKNSEFVGKIENPPNCNEMIEVKLRCGTATRAKSKGKSGKPFKMQCFAMMASAKKKNNTKQKKMKKNNNKKLPCG